MLHRSNRVVLIAVLALCAADRGLGAQESHQPGAGEHAAAGAPAGEHQASSETAANPLQPELPLAIWTLVVFLLLMFVLHRFGWKPLLEALHKRESHLERVLHDTERARNDSEGLLAEHRKQMARAAEEVRALLDKARQDAQTAADQIVRQAQEEAESARQRAQRDIASARDQALAEIWQKSADLAVSVAGRRAGQAAQSGRSSPPARRGHQRAARRRHQWAGRACRMTAENAAGSPPEELSFDDETVAVARRYAEALVDAAQKEGPVDPMLDELNEIEDDVLKPFPRFAEVLASAGAEVRAGPHPARGLRRSGQQPGPSLPPRAQSS